MLLKKLINHITFHIGNQYRYWPIWKLIIGITYRYWPIRKSVIIGISQYEKKLIRRPLTSSMIVNNFLEFPRQPPIILFNLHHPARQVPHCKFSKVCTGFLRIGVPDVIVTVPTTHLFHEMMGYFNLVNTSHCHVSNSFNSTPHHHHYISSVCSEKKSSVSVRRKK